MRFCVAVWVVFQILYTPIHLCQVPHLDEGDLHAASAAAPGAVAAVLAGDDDQDAHGHHERHPAAQHKFKVVSSERLVQVGVWLAPAVEWRDAEKACPQPPVFGFSGLSPPEFSSSWQFIFRAAAV